MSTKSEAIHAASMAADKATVTAWGVFGFLLPVVAIAVAYLRSPQTPTILLAEHDDDATTVYFDRQYTQTLKQRQVKAAWIGFLISLAVWCGLIFLIFMAVAVASV